MAQPGLTWKKHYRPGEFAPVHPVQPAASISPSASAWMPPARPGQTWRRHYRAGEFAPMRPLQGYAISPSYRPPFTPANPGRAWRQHFRPGAVHPVHNPFSPVAPEGIQGFDIAPIYHMMAG
jgi:hypothetical protein